ncbi:MAG: DUF2397 family protein [Myxococcales bacterium]|nr:DUF2397 family protein [Myxococcales bacterium]
MVTAERAPFYLTILYALLLDRRAHELEPLHEDVLARVVGPAGRHGAYDPVGFAHDVEQLIAWGAIDRITEAHKLRSYKDNRRERFRYRLTDDAVALLEWLEARLVARLHARVGDSRDRLTDLLGQVRELGRVLDRGRGDDGDDGGDGDDELARRAMHLVELIGDTIDQVGAELVGLRAEMLGFAARPYDLDGLRAILAWLERYLRVYVARVEELRAELAARLTELAAPRYRVALAGCLQAVARDRDLTPRGLGATAIADPSERLAAHTAFFVAGGPLARMTALVDSAARDVLAKMQRHVRELERRSTRLADLRHALAAVAAGPARDPRRAVWFEQLVASAQVRVDLRPATAAHRLAPPPPRGAPRAMGADAPAPLARKQRSLEAVRELAARRQALLRAWLARALAGHARVALADLAGSALAAAGGAARWIEVARAAHLGGGRGLRAAGARLRLVDGEVTIVDGPARLDAPAAWLEEEEGP